MTRQNRTRLLNLAVSQGHGKPMTATALAMSTHRDLGQAIAPLPPLAPQRALSMDWGLPAEERSTSIQPTATRSSAQSVTLSAPLVRRPVRAPKLAASEFPAGLGLPDAEEPQAHFLSRKDVERLPLHGGDAEDEDGGAPVAQQAPHDIFDRLQQQFTYANTFNLGSFKLDEHFSGIEKGLGLGLGHNAVTRRDRPASAALSAAELARGLEELAASGAETNQQDGEALAHESGPANDTPGADDGEDIYSIPPEPDEEHEEHVMARSILDMERAISARRAQKPAAAPTRNAAPQPSQAIANAQSQVRRGASAQQAFRSSAFGAVDYDVPGPIPQLQQPTGMSCWATVYTMLRDWKTQSSTTIQTALEAIDARWVKVFTDDSGLSSNDKVDFLSAAGLVARPPQSYSIQGWRQLLMDYGLLWVTTDENPGAAFSIHARVLYCMRGDGTARGTKMFFVDPADGQRHNETFTAFLEKYESEARDSTRPLRIQVVHWPQGARSMSARPLRPAGFNAQPRGIRNNNPGNIRLSNQAWEGKVPNAQNSDDAFEQFTTYAYGVRALIKLLRNYINGGRNTVRRIIEAYAPVGDSNHTGNYIAFVVSRLGSGGLTVIADTQLSANRQTLRLLSQAIGRMENGVEVISDAQFNEGFALLPPDDQHAIGQSSGAPLAYYAGYGEEAGGTEGNENDDIGAQAVAMEATVPAFCPVNSAPDAQTDHFRLSEFHSRDGEQVPAVIRGNVQAVMEQLEVLRAEAGKPIRITSGYRSEAHNRSVGGVPFSQHRCGIAADIRIEGNTPEEVHAMIERLITAGRMREGGLGLYPDTSQRRGFVHYDIRGARARW